MALVLLALTLAGLPELWASTQGLGGSACDSAAFADAIRAKRPDTFVHPWHPEDKTESPPARAIVARLSPGSGATLLEVTGAGAPVTRALPPSDGCEHDVEVAALIVDGALDDLRMSESAPPVDSLAPPVPLRKRLEVGAAIGAGIEQSMVGLAAAVDVEAVARYRFVELTLDVDVGAPSRGSFSVTLPEQPGTGSVSVTSVSTELGLGVAPRFGRSRVSADVLLGLAWASVSETPPSGVDLFQVASRSATELFTGLRLGYALDLPRGIFLAAHAEERLAPLRTTFVVSDSLVSTRAWTFQAVGLLGYRFL